MEREQEVKPSQEAPKPAYNGNGKTKIMLVISIVTASVAVCGFGLTVAGKIWDAGDRLARIEERLQNNQLSKEEKAKINEVINTHEKMGRSYATLAKSYEQSVQNQRELIGLLRRFPISRAMRVRITRIEQSLDDLPTDIAGPTTERKEP